MKKRTYTKCENCEFWKPIDEFGHGRCVLLPPVGSMVHDCEWPITFYYDGCYSGQQRDDD